MKNTQNSIFRKKGFFIALYSCLGAVAVLALVITFSPLGGRDPYAEDAAPVGADQVLPYQQQIEARTDDEAWFRPRPTPTPAPQPIPTPVPQPVTPQPPAVRPPATPPAVPTAPTPPATGETIQPNGTPAVTPSPAPRVTGAVEAPYVPAASYEDAAPVIPFAALPATFVPFTHNDRMIWPVEGEILMDFDAYTLVYDPTLDRFAINEDIRVAAQEGTPVRAGADGRVISIGNNVVQGNYVLVDHGNGWIARYGQLMDAIMVNEGDVIRTGQVIGGVGQPSYFGTMLGTHLNFQLTHEGDVTNPHLVLTER